MRLLNLMALLLAAISGCGTGSTDEIDGSPKLTEQNYALAETELIFSDYVRKARFVTLSNGVGKFLHRKAGANPDDRTIVRINFDTLYSIAIVDLTEDAILTLPETDGRYQSAWIVTDEHYNPMAFVEPGTYTLTQAAVGSRYAAIIIRTQVNAESDVDLAAANALQERLELQQEDRGSYTPSNDWDEDEVLKMRARYQALIRDEGITSEVMFGKKGEVALQNHNAGVAAGWGGMTPDRAVYPAFQPESNEPHTMTLRNVPAASFWSVTVYGEEGFALGESYNINSQFAEPNQDGSYTFHFGGDPDASNYLDIYSGWNVMLRLYEPTAAYFNGEWMLPDLLPVNSALD